jgi:hypothetical protein
MASRNPEFIPSGTEQAIARAIVEEQSKVLLWEGLFNDALGEPSLSYIISELRRFKIKYGLYSPSFPGSKIDAEAQLEVEISSGYTGSTEVSTTPEMEPIPRLCARIALLHIPRATSDEDFMDLKSLSISGEQLEEEITDKQTVLSEAGVGFGENPCTTPEDDDVVASDDIDKVTESTE